MSEAGSKGKYYLAGETVEEWRALSLRNLWTVEDTVQLLKTGRNRFASVSGNMVEVIHHSTQYVTDADLTAIATYLKSLPPNKNDAPMPEAPASLAVAPEDLFTTRGGLGLCAILCRLPSPGWGRGEGYLPLVDTEPHRHGCQPCHAAAYHPHRLENG